MIIITEKIIVANIELLNKGVNSSETLHKYISEKNPVLYGLFVDIIDAHDDGIPPKKYNYGEIYVAGMIGMYGIIKQQIEVDRLNE